MAGYVPTTPREFPRSTVAWAVILAGTAVAVVVVGGAPPDAKMFLALSLVILGIGAIVIPRAVRRDPSIPTSFFMGALAAHLVGSLVRFTIMLSVYHGVTDANAYVRAGAAVARQFRSLHPPPLPAPGTRFMEWLSGLLFAFTGPTMLGGFVVCSALSFVGAWYFYKAFRISFPDGNNRLYALLIFLLPSMWYWPSSLGKDAVIILFMGIATYGIALLLRGHARWGLLSTAIGVAGTVMIRPPMALALVASGAAAFLLRPTRVRAAQLQGLMWLLVIPVLAGVVFLTFISTRSFLGGGSFVEAYEVQRSTDLGTQGSNFTAPNALTPVGLPSALVTVNLRPFPWEAGSLLQGVASLEGVVLVLVLLGRRREIFRGLRMWRNNAMVVMVTASFFSIAIALSSLANFGLLARQRTQVLPFLFFLPAMVKPRAKSERKERPTAARADVRA